MSKKRLLLVGSLPPPYSGYETATQVLMECGLDRDFEVKLFDTRTTRNPSARGVVSVNNLFSMLMVCVRLLIVLARFRPHICNVPLAQNKTGFLKWLLLSASCRMSAAKLVSRLGGASFDEFYNRCKPSMRWLIRTGLRLPDRVIVRGDSLKQQLRGLVSFDVIDVVPNGFDIQGWMKASQSKAPLRKKEKVHVLFLGQVSKAKGVFDLLDAIGILKRKNKVGAYEFVIAGPIIEQEKNLLHLDNPASTSQAIEESLSRHQIKGMVEFVGEAGWDAKKGLYDWADIFVYPSYSEGGVSYSILEAFGSRCAVICTSVGALGDYLHDQEEVLFIPENSAIKLADALAELCDVELRRKLIENAKAYLESTHSLPTFSVKMRDVFNSVLTGNC